MFKVEGGQQHLLVDQHNPLTLARRPSTDLLPLVSGKNLVLEFEFQIFVKKVPAPLNEDHFQLVDNLPSIYFV